MKVGKEILRLCDELGPVQVFDDGNKRTLMFGDDDEQGCILKHNPSQVQYAYVRAMLLALVFQSAPQRCLVLGLGSSALVHALFKFWPGLDIDVVELRQAILDLAYSHFYLPRDKRISLIQADAGDFVDKGEDSLYDLIFSDLYLAEGMDEQQATETFIQSCHNRMTPEGILVLNYWVDHRSLNLLPILEGHFSQVRTTIIDNENWVILAHRKASTLNDKSIKSIVKALNTRLGFSLTRVASGLKISHSARR